MTALRITQLAPLAFGPRGAADPNAADPPVLPPPSTLAGFVRTVIGDHLGWDWDDPQTLDRARALAVRGALFSRGTDDDGSDAEFVCPAPRDAVDRPAGESGPVVRLAPGRAGDAEGSDLPAELSQPLEAVGGEALPLNRPSTGGSSTDGSSADGSSTGGPDWWRWTDFDHWLQGLPVSPRPVEPPALDVRLQAGQATRGGQAYAVSYRTWDRHERGQAGEVWRLVVGLAEAPPQSSMPLTGHLGGDRRPVVAEWVNSGLPEPSDALRAALTASTTVCVRLLTPAVFDRGWYPGWLDRTGHSVPRGGPWDGLIAAGAVLVSAAVGPPVAVGGWSVDRRGRGPKAARQAVPAGSVYYFRLDRALTEHELDGMWMQPISDGQQDRRDGFGTAAWGVWNGGDAA